MKPMREFKRLRESQIYESFQKQTSDTNYIFLWHPQTFIRFLSVEKN